MGNYLAISLARIKPVQTSECKSEGKKKIQLNRFCVLDCLTDLTFPKCYVTLSHLLPTPTHFFLGIKKKNEIMKYSISCLLDPRPSLILLITNILSSTSGWAAREYSACNPGPPNQQLLFLGHVSPLLLCLHYVSSPPRPPNS